jgi:hypothetical protein
MKQFLFLLATLAVLTMATICPGQSPTGQETQGVTIETTYDSSKDRTTVRLAPVKISGAKDKYHSLHMAPSFSFPGHEVQTPSRIDFELQTVVKTRLLDSDLYVDFLINGEKIFLSSSRRQAVKHPVRGRLWMGEVLIFRMPYETFVRITKAREFTIRFDGLEFPVGETERQSLRELLARMSSQTNPR